LVSRCSCVDAAAGFSEQGNWLTSPLNNDVAEFRLRLFATGACREPGVAVPIAAVRALVTVCLQGFGFLWLL